jgi:serine/threonine protein kinase
MQGLLEALLPTSDGTGRVEDTPSGRHLARFLDGEALPAPSRIGRELAVGESLGRFRIEQEIGRGGFGVVYRAMDTRLGRAVAIKVPRPDRIQSVALWNRFAREARIAGSLEHAAIVPVLDAGFLDGIICVVSAFQEGETLGHWLAARYPAGMPARLAARHAATIAAGLGHAHVHGVSHRDLKPANVLMVPRDAEASDWLPRIVDFGLGTIEADHDSQSVTGFWQGSPPYMAPEQVLPKLGRVDARSDIYALGAILYEMLSGRTLYACESILELSVALGAGEPPIRPRHLRHDIPRDVETIVLTCLERDPSRRYSTAAALVEDLNRFLDGRPVLARPLSAPPATRPLDQETAQSGRPRGRGPRRDSLHGRTDRTPPEPAREQEPRTLAEQRAARVHRQRTQRRQRRVEVHARPSAGQRTNDPPHGLLRQPSPG